MADYRYKVEIELDEGKILQDNKYSLENVYKSVCKSFIEKGIEENRTNNNTLIFSTSREDDAAFSDVWIAIVNLIRAEWFRPYVAKLLWYNAYEGEDYFEDTLAAFANKGY